jgi:DNA-directed RNA polymerase specialized sigma24 family protein
MKIKADNDALVLKNYHTLAYNYALYKVGSIDAAEDIASQTIYSYLLKREKIEKNNHEGWIVNTSKNYCSQHFDRLKAEKKLQYDMMGNMAGELQSKIYESLDFVDNEKNELLDAVKKAKDTLSPKELQTYILYLQCETNVQRMENIIGESNQVIRQRISRINRKIKAETYKKLGVITTKKILSPQINNIIRKFLLRFKSHLENNTLNKMFYYFSKKDLGNYKPRFYIKKVLDYEVVLRDSIYSIHVVFTNEKDMDESFFFSFTVENNSLKVLQPPTPHKEHYQISGEDAEILFTLLQKYPEDSTGRHNIPEEELAIFRRLMGEEDE